MATQKPKKWMGTNINCNFCDEVNEWFVDGKVRTNQPGQSVHSGPWAIMCKKCFPIHGVGLGLGKGQKYDSATLEKLEG